MAYNHDPFEGRNSNFKLVPQSLTFIGAIPIGSRALGLSANKYTDHDFVVLKRNWDILMEGHHNEVSYYPIEEYFNVQPTGGSNHLAKYTAYPSIDIVILEREEDVQAVSRAMRKLLALDKEELKFKHWRITAFEKELLRQGFKIRTTTRRNPNTSKEF